LKANPTDKLADKAQFYLGLTQINLDDPKGARETLRTFLQRYPQSKHVPSAHYWIGFCSYSLSDDPSALKELTEFVELVKDDPLLERALTYLGELELKPEALQLDKAIKHLELAVSKFPMGNVVEDSRYFLAQAYALQMQGEKARKLYTELAAKSDGSRAADAQFQLGLLDFNSKNFAEAIKAFDKLEEQYTSSPLVPVARFNRAIAQSRSGELAAAIDSFGKLAADPKFGAQATFQKGLCHKALSQWEAAVAAFRTVAETPTVAGAEDASFQWGICEQQRGNFDAARERFLKTIETWPKGKFVDESLYRAAGAAFNARKFAECDALLTRFDKEFPGNKLRYWQGILRGRLLLESAAPDASGDAQRELAAATLQGVVDKTGLEDTRISARYYLAQVLQAQKQYAKILAVTEPLLAAFDKDPVTMKEWASTLVLRGASALTLGKKIPQPDQRRPMLEIALAASQKYLTGQVGGELTDQALAVHAMAAAHAGQKEVSAKDLGVLRANYPNSHWFDDTLLEVGQVAFSSMDYELAEQVFSELTKHPQPRLQPLWLLELGSTLQKQKRYADAATVFAKLVAEFPESPEAPESGYLHGQMLELDDKLDAAQTAFHSTFVRYGIAENAYLAGRASARLLVRLKRIDEADTLFAAIADRFQMRKDLDLLLEDWAVANRAFMRHPRADEIYRKLATQFPDSKLADDALLSLAESDFVSGKGEGVRSQFRELADSPKSDADVQQRALYQMMQIDLEARRWAELRKLCQESLKRFPMGDYVADAQFHAAEADFQTEDFAGALPHLLKIHDQVVAAAQAPDKSNGDELRLKHWYPMIWVMLAEMQFREKKYTDAVATAAEFTKMNPKSDHQYYLDEILGRVLKQQAKFAEARTAFERVVDDEYGRGTETAAKSQFHIGETYFFEKDYTHAVQEYLKVQIRYKYPEWQGLGLFQAAGCYEALNDWKEAVKTYEDMLKDFPKHSKAADAKQRLEAARVKAGM